MDAKKAFDEIRAHFSSRPHFQELEHELNAMARLCSHSFVRESGTNFLCGGRSGAHLATPSLRTPLLPPPIVRPAEVETLLHPSATLPVWKIEGKGSGRKNGKADRCGFTISNDYSQHGEDIRNEPSSFHHLTRSQGRGFPTFRTAAMSQRCEIPTKHDYVCSADKVWGMRSDGDAHQESVLRLSSCSEFGAMEEATRRGGQPCCAALALLRDLDEASVLRHVRSALRIYRCQKRTGEEDDCDESSQKGELWRKNGDEEMTSSGAPAVVSPPAADPERMLHWSPEVGERTVTGAMRSALAAELDYLESSHHTAVAEMLKREITTTQTRKTAAPVALTTHDGMQCAPMGGGASRHFGALLDATPAGTSRTPALGTAGVGAKEDGALERSQKERLELPQEAAHHTRMDGKIMMGTWATLHDYDSANSPVLSRMHSTILAPAHTNNTQMQNARHKWSSVSVV